MGGAVSELRSAIHTHVVITQHYPLLLEPYLAAVQFFLRTAESGEGTDHERAIDDIPMDVVMTDKRLFEEASTEVELLVENKDVMRALLHGVENHSKLELSPENDPFRQWYDPPWRQGKKPMPQYVEVPIDQVPRFRIAILRCSIRCLRLMMFCTDGKTQLEEMDGPRILNNAALQNPLDDYVKNDVKAIFKSVFGGDNAVRRIAIGDLPIVVEMLMENRESAIVQLAGVQRVCHLLGEAKAFFYTPTDPKSGSPTHTTKVLPIDAPTVPPVDNDETIQQNQLVQQIKLFADLETYDVVSLLTETLNRFDVDKFLSLYVHVCRFISYVATEERNAKLIGQCGGIEGAIRLLFKAREMQRTNRFAEKEELARQARLQAGTANDWSGILDADSPHKTKSPPPPAPIESGEKVTSIESLSVVDYTPTEIGQQAMWALDLLARLDYNVAQMKLHKLKYLLKEIQLDPENHELGKALIITRRLRLIRWDQILGANPEEIHKKKKREE